MSANLAAMLYATLAIGIAVLVLPGATFAETKVRSLAVWFLSAALLFFLDDALLIFAFLFIILAVLASILPAQRVAFFILAAPAVPFYVQQYLPFPGINYLTLLDYYRVASFTLLLPLLFLPRPADLPRIGWTLTDSCVALYVLYTSTMVGGAENFTSGLRFLLDQSLLVAAPYFALTRAVRRPEDVDRCIRAFIVASAILAAIALIATSKQWDFYRFKEPPSQAALPDFRAGFLRIAATANTHSLGFHLAACIVLLEYLKTRIPFGFLRLWGLRAMLFGGLYLTGSRGAIAALLTAAGVYVVLSVRSSGLRWALTIAIAGGAWAAGTWLLSGDSAKFDPYGTFDYRQQLLATSLQYIADNPLFGSVHFIRSGRFDALVQGQGIIDITNLYLQVALRFGLIGLTLFFLPFLLTLYRLAFTKRDSAIEPGVDRMRFTICALIAGWLVLIATTSDVGLTLHLGLVLLALARPLMPSKSRAPQPSTTPAAVGASR